MTQATTNERLFQFSWSAPPSSTTSTTSTTSKTLQNQNNKSANQFKFSLNSNDKEPIASSNRRSNNNSNSMPDWSTFKMNEPFKFDFDCKEIETTMTAQVNPNNNKENNFNFTFSAFIPAKPGKSEIRLQRRIKFPQFEKVATLSDKIVSLKMEIKEQETKLNNLLNKEISLTAQKKNIQKDIDNWYKNWKLWNCDDFFRWIFEEIDNGYFKYKQNINNNMKFDKTEFRNKLNIIINRFDKNKQFELFEGKHISSFDILDVKELFNFLGGDDCRKLFGEIQELTKMERLKNKCNKNQFNQICGICIANQKQFALGCGHIFCGQCIHKMRCCPLCKKTIQKNRMIKIFL